LILADSSIWIDHFRSQDEILASLLEQERVLAHPFVIGEIALGNLRQRSVVLKALHQLPEAVVARDAEVLTLIENSALSGLGIGYVDAHLLAAVRLTDEARLWTRDKRLAAAAARLDLAATVLN